MFLYIHLIHVTFSIMCMHRYNINDVYDTAVNLYSNGFSCTIIRYLLVDMVQISV